MKNAHTLRTELSKTFTGLQAGEITHKDAAEMANIAGKMINSAKVQFEYYNLIGATPTIRFLEEPKHED